MTRMNLLARLLLLSSVFASCKNDLDVGSVCVPQNIPCDADGNCGYSPLESAIDTNPASCDDVCLVRRLDNGTNGRVLANPVAPLCEAAPSEGCVSALALEAAVYCSCQCDGPGSRSNYCTCPDDFACTEIAPRNSSEPRASYCVRRAP
jgi:hypothetical protein